MTERSEFDPFSTVALEAAGPTTDAQREIWLASQLDRGAALAYNEAVRLDLHGTMDRQTIVDAVASLVARHDALRSTFSPDGDEIQVLESIPLAVEIIDVVDDDGEAQERSIALVLQRAVTEPFHLEKGPLFRAFLVCLGLDRHVLVLAAHHIVCDGWSFSVLAESFADFCRHRIAGDVHDFVDAPSFAEYVHRRGAMASSPRHDQDLRYWSSLLSDGGAALDLPTDQPRKAVRSFASDRLDRHLDAALVSRLKAYGASAGAGLFATLLGCFGAWLGRVAASGDVVVGVPAAGQLADDEPQLVGHCVSVLPVRLLPALGLASNAYLADVQERLFGALEHQSVSLGAILQALPLERDPSRLPLTSVLFNLERAFSESDSPIPGVNYTFASVPRRFENFELFVNAVQVPSGIRLECQYNCDLFARETISRWLSGFETFLEALAATPGAPLGHLPITPRDELEAIARFQPTPTDYPDRDLLHDHFLQQATRTPDNPAVVFCGQTTSYAELAALSRGYARALAARGVGPGSTVGVFVERSADMVAVVLGVSIAGGTYLPLDPSFPPDRLAYMLADSGANLVVSQRSLEHIHSRTSITTFVIDDLELTSESDRDDTDRAIPEHRAEPDSAIYVIYTSGSTGKPKGVCVPHRAVSNFLHSMKREPGLSAGDVLVAVTTLSFDIAVLELFLPLTVGATVVLASREESSDGATLAQLLDSSAANVMQATPATWRLLLGAGWRGNPGFKILCGGEPLPQDLAAQLLERCGELWNVYGPTETTVWSTCGRVTRADVPITIGRPIANTTVWVLDENRQVCPIGIPGEIYIGGDGVTLGYHARPELTAERFVPDPFAQEPGRRLYRTGDRGRWLPSGEIQHLGRIDFQVKVRGYRIELGEIEHAVTAVPGAERTVVVTREDTPGDVRIVAYVVRAAGATLDAAALRRELRRSLPDYMVPQHFVFLDRIPLLPNGKIDRKSLPAPTRASSTAPRPQSEATGELERLVLAAFEDALSLPGVGVEDDFFSLGGHSLLAARLAARLTQDFGVAVSLRTLFESPTARGLAQAISLLRQSGGTSSRYSIPHRAGAASAPLSGLQRGLWFMEEINPGTPTYNTPSAHRLRGAMNEAAFERAFNLMVRRQESLRTAFRTEGGVAEQYVVEKIETSLFPSIDLSSTPEHERYDELLRQMQVLTDAPFDLQSAPLFRARMFRLGPEDHVFFFSVHHLVWDGWSFDLMYEEMSTYYAAFCAGEDVEVEPLPVSYGDYAEWNDRWLSSEDFAAQLGHWKQRLGGMLRPRELPTDRPRRPLLSGRGATQWVELTQDEAHGVHAFGRAHGGTAFMTLLALYAIALRRMTGEPDVIVGTPVRARGSTDLERVMGLFTNLLPVPLTVDVQSTFPELLQQVRDSLLESYTYPEVPFTQIVQTLPAAEGHSQSHLYHGLFSFQDARDRPTDWGSLRHEQIRLFQQGAAEDLGFWLLEHRHGMIGGVTYNADVFEAETASAFRQSFLDVLRTALKTPGATVGELSRARNDELAQLADWRRAAPAPAPHQTGTLDAQLRAQAASRPDAIAIAAPSGSHTFAHLLELVDRCDEALHRAGLRPGQRVAVALPRSARLVGLVLAALRRSMDVVLLDPKDHPTLAGRLAFEAGAALLVVADATSRDQSPAISCSNFDELLQGAARPAPSTTAIQQGGSHVAPRTAAHGNESCLGAATMDVACSAFGTVADVRAGKRVVIGQASIASSSLVEVIGSIAAGAQVTLAGGESESSLAATRHSLEAGFDLALLDAETWDQLVATGWSGAPDATIAYQDEAPSSLGVLLQHSRAVMELTTLPGLVGFATSDVVTSEDRIGRTGRPLPGVELRVIDAQGEEAPVGTPGLLELSGPAVTGTRPAGAAAPAGRWRHDGRVELRLAPELERLHRGNVLRFDVIERQVRSVPGVEDVKLSIRKDANRARLVAEIRCDERAGVSPSALRPKLQMVLRAWEMPDDLVINDDAAKPMGGLVTTRTVAATREPTTATELRLAEIWREVLVTDDVGMDDNFFELGGNSMQVMQVLERMEALTRKRVNARQFLFDSLATLAAAYDATPEPAVRKGLFDRLTGSLRRRTP